MLSVMIFFDFSRSPIAPSRTIPGYFKTQYMTLSNHTAQQAFFQSSLWWGGETIRQMFSPDLSHMFFRPITANQIIDLPGVVVAPAA